ncbi:peptidase [Candidatus Magnetomorum sp. HK-1]|nr:peptidase [Candidatus Magnetomorum sp. HK-1]
MLLISDKDFADLKKAKMLLEKKSIAIKMANIFGSATEAVGSLLPVSYRESISKSNLFLIEKTWDFSLSTMPPPNELSGTERKHIFWVTVSGAIGGVGIVTLFLELPVTTVLMLRAIADIAIDEGEDYNQFETKIASLESFALGGDAFDDQTGETGYYAIRNILQKPLEESSKYIAQKGMAGMGAPFVAQLLAKIGARYQTVLSTQTVAKAIPIVGAVAGAYINVIFINFFQDKARGHFIIRRLEKKYGDEIIRQTYNKTQISELKNTHTVYINTQNEIKKNCSPYVKAEQILRRHIWGAMGIGLIPVPIMDFAVLSLLQLMLLRKLAKVYEVPFSNDMAKSVISSLFSSSLSFPTAVLTFGIEKLVLTASIAKFIPGIGVTVAAATMPVIAGAATYALGKVFIRHFGSGGTFLTLDPDKAQNYYRKMFEEGTHIVKDMKKIDV